MFLDCLPLWKKQYRIMKSNSWQIEKRRVWWSKHRHIEFEFYDSLKIMQKIYFSECRKFNVSLAEHGMYHVSALDIHYTITKISALNGLILPVKWSCFFFHLFYGKYCSILKRSDTLSICINLLNSKHGHATWYCLICNYHLIYEMLS